MRKHSMIIIIALFTAVAAQADGFRELDLAVSSLTRGFERGESHPIVNGIGDQVMLEFPGLVSESGFFGRDQASYVLDELFKRALPTGFDVMNARKVSAQNQYHINGKWSIEIENESQTREVHITLQNRDDRWFVASIRSLQ